MIEMATQSPLESRPKTSSSEFSQFGHDELRATLLTRDTAKAFDRKLWRQLAALGFFRRALSENLGGSNIDLTALAEDFRALGRGSLDIPFCVSAVAQLICVDVLARFGSAEQKAKYLEALVSGEMIAAVCNSEAAAGTDIKAIASTLTDSTDGSAFLDLSKRGATNLGSADLVFCSVWRHTPDAKPGLEVIILEGKAVAQTSHVSALAGFWTGLTGSGTARASVSDPTALMLGAPYSGFNILKHCFNLERLLIGAAVSGVLEGVMEDAVTFIKNKTSFGKALAEHQFMQDKIINIYSSQQKIQGLVHSIVTARPQSSSIDLTNVTKTLAVLKMATIDDGAVAIQAFYEVFGFSSYSASHMAQKLLRDHTALRFLGGSKEQQKILLYSEIERDILKKNESSKSVPTSTAIH